MQVVSRWPVFVAAVAAFTLGFTVTPAISPALGQPDETLTNLDHLDFLYDEVQPPDQPNHETYRLDEEPDVGMLWTYAEPEEDDTYRRIGGGDYDPETDTYLQGAFNADDISRAAIVYVRHWQQFGDEHSRVRAYQLLRGLTYLQPTAGDNRGNVVLWAQPDGTLNRSAEPVEQPDPSDSGPSYWLARTIWALGEGFAAFSDADPDFAAFLAERLELSLDAVERQVLDPNYGDRQIVDGLSWPAWLIVDGADASAEAVYGLAAYVSATGDPDALRALEQLAEAIAELRPGDAREWPFGALLPWAQSRSIWHAWGDQMVGALAAASSVSTDDWTSTVAEVAGTFTPHLLAQGGPDHSWMPAPAEESQIAYGADATLQNLLQAYDLTGREGFHELAGIAASWYFGNNPAGIAMYDPDTGRTFDGVFFDGSVNRNSGAESTIHGLLSMLAIDADPVLAERARDAERVEHVTWQLVEAEDGERHGSASVVELDDPWTGESLWSGGAYVELGPDGRIALDVDVPAEDRYLVMPVLHRQQLPTGRLRTRHRLDETPAGLVDHGGAGDQGVTPMAGFLDIVASETMQEQAAGPATLEIAHGGPACPADLVPAAGFPDPSPTFQPYIDCLVAYELASGRRDGTYGPTAPVTRGQMATFVRHLLEESGLDLDTRAAVDFTDVDGSVHEGSIRAIANTDPAIVQGFGDGTFRPHAMVRRDQMASFLATAHEVISGEALPAPATAFTDIDGNVHADNIERLAGAGITVGTTATTYAPRRNISRGQMAAFVGRHIDILIDLGHVVPRLGHPTRVDAVYLTPFVEWLVLDGPAGGQAVARSFAEEPETRVLTLPGASVVEAAVYDGEGRLQERVTEDGDTIRAPIAPYGFTVTHGSG